MEFEELVVVDEVPVDVEELELLEEEVEIQAEDPELLEELERSLLLQSISEMKESTALFIIVCPENENVRLDSLEFKLSIYSDTCIRCSLDISVLIILFSINSACGVSATLGSKSAIMSRFRLVGVRLRVGELWDEGEVCVEVTFVGVVGEVPVVIVADSICTGLFESKLITEEIVSDEFAFWQGIVSGSEAAGVLCPEIVLDCKVCTKEFIDAVISSVEVGSISEGPSGNEGGNCIVVLVSMNIA